MTIVNINKERSQFCPSERSRRKKPQLSYQNKIQNLAQAIQSIAVHKKEKRKIVFTNGCFDLLHKGHIYYLEKAKELGDVLVVGLNSDASVRKLKGKTRPIKDVENRSAVLAGLGSVDVVVVFEEETPIELIKLLIPDVLVKGGDYSMENIVGADFVIRNGGEVKVIDFVEGQSSSAIIKKMEKE